MKKKLIIMVFSLVTAGVLSAADYTHDFNQLTIRLKNIKQTQDRMTKVGQMVQWNNSARILMPQIQDVKKKKFLRTNIEKNNKFILEVGAPQPMRPGLRRGLLFSNE